MEDLNQFVKSVVGISKESHNAVQVLAKIADYENLEKDLNRYKDEVNIKKDELTKLDQVINDKKNTLDYFKIKIEIINELETVGFGNKELRTLYTMLNEIGLENNLDFNETRKQFFDDVKNYDAVIGSRKEIDRLKNRTQKSGNENYEGKRKIHCLSASNRSHT